MIVEFPFFTVGLFSAIAGIILYLMGLGPISQICFVMVLVVIIAKIFTVSWQGVEHPVSKFCIICFFAGLILMALGGLGITTLCAELGKNEIPPVITTIGSYFIKVSLGGVLFRIFIAMFIGY